jgi:hypothetical protein
MSWPAWAAIGLAAWLFLAAIVAVPIGRSIHAADQREQPAERPPLRLVA